MKSAARNRLQLSLTDVTYPAIMRFFLPVLLLTIAACHGDIYTRDGVTDGDTFYLAPSAFENNDPAFQSWVAYSLMKSACQLRIGAENPARANSFACEYEARRHLVDAWEEKRQQDRRLADRYLDTLSDVHAAGYLAEYTTRYFGRKAWRVPDGLRAAEFRRWRRAHLRGHRPLTRVIGSWNYRQPEQ